MKKIKIYNTLTQKKELFIPIYKNIVKMYVCGITVYDYCHLGHARVMVVFDMIKKWLCISGFKVIYIRNITDIDDKIINTSILQKKSINNLTNYYINAMKMDLIKLGIQKPDYEPKVTNFIPQIIKSIYLLKKNGLAYKNSNKDINYSVKKFKNYGNLSKKILKDLIHNKKILSNYNKLNFLDFVLWKFNKKDEPKDAKWPSPWGYGRPGWHIECSAISNFFFGKHFDIHGGGQDLQFPHHENEIAQSEGIYKSKFVNYWIHIGIVKILNKKMSKSLNNFITIRKLLCNYNSEVIRFFILKTHYRSSLNYSEINLNNAKISLISLYNSLKKFSNLEKNSYKLDLTFKYTKLFFKAMNNDFNTSQAINILFILSKKINKKKSLFLAQQLKLLGNTIGLLNIPINIFFKKKNKYISEKEIEKKIFLRLKEKKKKNFLKADLIRNELKKLGIFLEDSINGTKWYKK